MNTCETIYYDFETTGLNPFHDRIIEYAFVRENDDTSISSLVNPLKKFPKFITDLTGIYPEELENKLEKLPMDNNYKLYISSLLKSCGYKDINSTYKCYFYKPLISKNLIN